MSNATAPPAVEFVAAFEASLARLQLCVEEACARQPDWATGVAAGTRAALGFAAADPGAARLLSVEALASGAEGRACYLDMIAHFVARLEGVRDGGGDAEQVPATIERALVGGLVMLVARRLDEGAQAELPGFASEAIRYLLTPYLGPTIAAQVAVESCE